jgi:F-type H+-transporting ATPase subunit b
MWIATNPLIEVRLGLMVWTIVCFGFTFLILRRFAFGPIQNAINERRERIRRSLEEAEKARTEARKLLDEHRALLGQARGQGEEILADARKVADSMARRMREETEADRQRRLEETRREIQAETQRALQQIRAEVAELTLIATTKVTGKVLEDDDQKRLIDEAIRDLDFSVLEQEPTR